MIKIKKYIIFILCLLISGSLYTQTLEELLQNKMQESAGPEYTQATFKSTRIVSGQSIENPEKQDLLFVIGHRFGSINSGFYDFFGLDLASTRLGFNYGITDRLCVGGGRSTYLKTFDAYFKYKIIRQSTGSKTMPVSISIFSAADINTVEPVDPEVSYSFVNRLSYVTEVLIARKFNPKFSFQITPTLVHKNLVARKIDPNYIFALGSGARMKLTQRVTLNAEYFHIITGQTAEDYSPSLSFGFDIETGGHVFQLHITNSRSMVDRGFITETSGNWMDGDIHFGFNIARVFGLGNRSVNK